MIALYQGISVPSRLIRWGTWSQYSHAAWVNPNTGTTIEAWRSGVREVPSFNWDHTPGTVVDFFDVPAGPDRKQRIEAFLREQVGKPYDWFGILHFVTRRPEYARDQAKWFCSELIFRACRDVGLDLHARIEPWQVSPGLLSISTLLIPAGRLVSHEATPADEGNTPPLLDRLATARMNEQIAAGMAAGA